ncbi:MAG: hypothetical protein WCJ81_09355 [bacterium]
MRRPWSTFSGYVLELYLKDHSLKNIVFLAGPGHVIYTFADTPQHIKSFLLALDDYLPLLDDFHQTSFEKLIRRIQL